MILKEITTVYTSLKGVVALLDTETPASLEVSGADVAGLPDDYVIAAGSLLETSEGEFVAFEDGVFTKRACCGGGSSDGETATVTFINSEDGYYYDVLINGTTYSIYDSQTVTFDLLGGYALIGYDAFSAFNSAVTPIITGEIEMVSTGFKVTGDGTITIAGSGEK